MWSVHGGSNVLGDAPGGDILPMQLEENEGELVVSMNPGQSRNLFLLFFQQVFMSDFNFLSNFQI